MLKSSQQLPNGPPLTVKQRINAVQKAHLFPGKPLFDQIISGSLASAGSEGEGIRLLSYALDPDPNADLPEERGNTLEKRVRVVVAMLLNKLDKLSFGEIISQEDLKPTWQQSALCLLAKAGKGGAAMDIFSKSGFDDKARQHELGEILPLMQALVSAGQADRVSRIVGKFKLPQEDILHRSPHFIGYRKLFISMNATTHHHHGMQSLKSFTGSAEHIAHLQTVAKKSPDRVGNILAGNPIDADIIGLPHVLSETSPGLELLKRLIHEGMTEEVWALIRPLSDQESSWKLLPVLMMLVSEGMGEEIWGQIYTMDFTTIKQGYFADRYLALLMCISDQLECPQLREAIRTLS